MFRYVILGALMLPFAACSPSPPPTAASSDAPAADPGAASVATVEFGIGDVETSIEFELAMSDKTDTENVRYTPRLTKKYELAMANIYVRKPYPEELWLKLSVRSYDSFAGHAIQVTPRIVIDDREVASFPFLYGANALMERKEFLINIMEHLDPVPPSILVVANTDLNLFLNTDESTVTVETPVGPETQSVVKMSNPVRIDFLP